MGAECRDVRLAFRGLVDSLTAHARGTDNIYLPLCHNCHQVTVASLVRDVPPEAQDNDAAVKVTALE
jgi:hypothetical protein